MQHEYKKYLTLALVFLATLVAGVAGINYLENVRSAVIQQQAANTPEEKTP